MPMRAKSSGGLLRFALANGTRFGGAPFHAAAVAAGHVQVMNLPAGLPEQQQRPGHVKLNVVRMRGDGDDGFHDGQRKRNPSAQRNQSNFTGFPVTADSSAAKMTLWL